MRVDITIMTSHVCLHSHVQYEGQESEDSELGVATYLYSDMHLCLLWHHDQIPP